eukprot:CAMPEP_0170813612 /NCGR_PEP_ID=MMETSP0733-20121128/36997_1 /TAXON_ID=186038 /ORGANISM="Fragilariopsis kerguelensis, Strain L26-C5" /LENGTH=78 /DNA_ID=CAMNT_0011171073 /DNA_START=131 /DNA_END=367 /DNA_ORIENTATION=+
MGNAMPNPIAAMGAKNAAKGTTDQVKDGFNSLTAGQTEKQIENQTRAKDRAAEFAQKKKDREERKKKLANQWADNKKG